MSLLAVVVSCAMVFAMLPVSALAAEGETGTTDGWEWTILEDNTLAITKCEGKSGTVTIPESFDTGEKGPGVLLVTEIGDGAFNNGMCGDITGIVLPAGLKKICQNGFVGTSISSITIPAGCQSIGGSAFNGVGLTSITFGSPSSLQSIGDNAFLSTGLTSVVVPDSVSSIGVQAFAECTRLGSITLPHNSGFTAIRDTTFGGCSALHSIDIPSSVTSLGSNVFMASGLQGITIPAGITSIGTGVFGHTASLSSIAVDPANTKFASQDGVLFNKAMTELYSCPGGKSDAFTIPDGVTVIKGSAFSGCKNITEITIPSSVTSIEDYAFIYCNNLLKVYVKSRNAVFSDQNVFGDSLLSTAAGGGIYGIEGSTAQTYAQTHKTNSMHSFYIPFYPIYYVVSYNLGNGSVMPDAAVNRDETMAAPPAPTFAGCDFGGWYTDETYATAWDFANDEVTEDMTLYAKWTRDGEVYRSGETDHFIWETVGTELTVTGYSGSIPSSLVIPDTINTGISGLGTLNVTGIGKDAFNTYYMVTSFTLPSNLKSIGESAFYGCSSLTSVSIPASVEDIGESAFDGCISLGIVTIAGTSSLQSIGKNAFRAAGITSFAMPNSVTDVGTGAFEACYGLASVTLSNQLDEISDDMFLYCQHLSSISIPASVETIGNDAFSNSALTGITIPDTVTEIGESAFESCQDLISATLPDNASFTTIPNSLFYNCTSLSTVNFPAHVTAIGDYAFSVTGFTDVVIPDSVTSISGSAFSYCSLLESIELPDNASFVTIPDYLLFGCSALQTVVIPSHVTAIGEYVFAESGLKDLTIPSQITSIGEGAFSYCTSLESLDLPDNALFVTIPDSLLSNCAALQTIVIPSHVTTIGEMAFFESGLTDLTIPSEVTSIAEGALFGTQLSEITIPASVTSIGSYAISDCQLLSAINVNAANTHFSSEDGVLYNLDKTILLALPCAKSGAFTVPDGVKTIADFAFYRCLKLTEVSLPQSVTLIGTQAFISCEGLKKVSIKNNDTVFGNEAFNDTDLDSDGIYGIEDSTADDYAEDMGVPFHIAYCTVKFDSKGGSAVSGLIVDINERITLPAAPTRTGHEFGGWFKDTDCTIAWKFDSDTVSKNTTLYAKWTANTYTITFDSQGATVDASPGTKTVLNGQTLDVMPTEPQKSGYLFGGWWTKPNGGGTPFAAATPVTVNTTLYAKWISIIPVAMSCSVTDAPLYGTNGNITITASGGNSGTYLYSVDGGTHWSSTNSFAVTAGTYTAAVCDASNNTNGQIQTVKVSQPSYMGTVPAKKIASKPNAGTALTIKPPAPSRGYTVVSVTYSSSNPSIATVDASGNVTFLAKGKATIITTVISTMTDGKGRVKTKTTTIKKTVAVQQPVSTISLNVTDTTIERAQKVKLSATLAPTSASNKKLSWRSSNPKIASVSSSGVVTGKAGGMAIITCTAKDGSGVSASCTVTVKSINPTAIQLSRTACTVKPGKTISLRAKITPRNTDFKTVTWTSSNPSVVSVDIKGKVKALSSGTAVITATTSNGISVYCTVTVK